MGASGGRSTGVLRLGLLVAVAALFALIPAGQASAATFELEITEMGQGEVTCSVENVEVDCEESFEEGEEVTLLAQPDPEFELVGFSGDCTPIGSEECLVIMEGATPKKVTVTFKPIEYDLTVEAKGTGSGSVECEIASERKACAKTYPEGTSITLIAKAGSDSVLAGWGAGDCEAEPSEAECELEMLEDHVVAVTFNRVGGGGGSGQGSGGSTQAPIAQPIAARQPGKAKIAGAGLYKGGKAILRISCKGGGSCKGTVKLVAKLKVGGKQKKLTVGQAPFKLAANASKALIVKLSAPAKNLLAKGKTLIAKVGGSGVTASTLRINPTER